MSLRALIGFVEPWMVKRCWLLWIFLRPKRKKVSTWILRILGIPRFHDEIFDNNIEQGIAATSMRGIYQLEWNKAWTYRDITKILKESRNDNICYICQKMGLELNVAILAWTQSVNNFRTILPKAMETRAPFLNNQTTEWSRHSSHQCDPCSGR